MGYYINPTLSSGSYANAICLLLASCCSRPAFELQIVGPNVEWVHSGIANWRWSGL